VSVVDAEIDSSAPGLDALQDPLGLQRLEE